MFCCIYIANTFDKIIVVPSRKEMCWWSGYQSMPGRVRMISIQTHVLTCQDSSRMVLPPKDRVGGLDNALRHRVRVRKQPLKGALRAFCYKVVIRKCFLACSGTIILHGTGPPKCHMFNPSNPFLNYNVAVIAFQTIIEDALSLSHHAQNPRTPPF